MTRYRSAFTVNTTGGGAPVMLYGEETGSLAIAREEVLDLRRTAHVKTVGFLGCVEKRETPTGAWVPMDYDKWNPNGMH